jgi:hypothetical protein
MTPLPGLACVHKYLLAVDFEALAELDIRAGDEFL